MLFANSLEMTNFPVEVTMRDGKTTVITHDNGRVFCRREGGDEFLLAECAPDSPAIRPFLEFWGVILPGNWHSLAFTQLIQEIEAGRVIQDLDCPSLFLDLAKAEASPRKDEFCGIPLIKADLNGAVRSYNPDNYYANQGYALASNHRVKFYVMIEDFDGNDLPTGWRVGLTQDAGKEPVFDGDGLAQNEEQINELSKSLLAAYPTPRPKPAPVKDPDWLF